MGRALIAGLAAGAAALAVALAVALRASPSPAPGSGTVETTPPPIAGAAPADPFAGEPGRLVLVLGDAGGPGDLPGRGTESRLGPISSLAGERGGSLVYAPAHDARLVRIRADGVAADVFPEGIRVAPPRGWTEADGDGTMPLSRLGSIASFVPAPDGAYFASIEMASVVVRIGPDGHARVVAGRPGRRGLRDGPTGRSLLGAPGSLALAGDGTLYVVDRLNAAIRRLHTDGRLETLYRGRIDRRGGLPNPDPSRPEPERIAIDGDGRLWMVPRLEPGVGRNHALYRLDAAGRVDRVVGAPLVPGDRDGAADTARFDAPVDLGADPDGHLWVSEWGGHMAIRRVERDGRVTSVARSPCPGGSLCPALTTDWTGPVRPAALGTGGERPFLETGDGAIYRLEPDGRAAPFAGRRGCVPPTDGERERVCLAGIRALARHPDGSLIALDGDAVRQIGQDGRTRTLVGPEATVALDPPSTGAARSGFDPAPGTTLSAAAGTGLVVDPDGRIIYGLLAEGIAAREPDGRLRVVAHPEMIRDDEARWPLLIRAEGMARSADGRLLVTDAFAVWRIDPVDGRVELHAGQPGEPGDRDGRGEAARLRMPKAVSVAPDGTAFVGDESALRRIAPDGMVTTVGLEAATLGSGPCGLRPDAIAVGADGTLWFATSDPPRVGRLRPGGDPEWIAGDRSLTGVRPGPLPGVLAPVRALLPTADGGVLIASGQALLKALPARPDPPAALSATGGCGSR